MDQPILDILENCRSVLDGGIDEWMDAIETHAPGYLASEEAGQQDGYDHGLFMLN